MFYADVLNRVTKDVIEDFLKTEILKHVAQKKSSEIIDAVVTESLKENFEIIYFYAEVPNRDLDKIASEICDPLFEKLLTQKIERIVKTAFVKESLIFESQKIIIENTIRDEISSMISSSRRQVAQTKMLVCDDLRTKVIDQIVIETIEPILKKLTQGESAIQSVEKKITDDVLDDLIKDIVKSEIELTKSLDNVLAGSWVSHQPDFSYLSAGGRRLLVKGDQEYFTVKIK